MIVKSREAKDFLIQKLRSQGYNPYARLLIPFDVYLTDNPDDVGYMYPEKAIIVLNRNLDADQVSTIVRHEILHEYLKHYQRELKYNKEHGYGEQSIDREVANIAGDLEISNVGYTDEDKVTARSIVLNNRVLRGLVTEFSYPGWENDTFEQMYEKLLKEREEDKEEFKQILKQMQQISGRSLEEIEKELSNIQQNSSEESESGEGSPESGESSKGSDKDDTQSDAQAGDGQEESGEDKQKAKINKAAGELKKEVKDLQKDLSDNVFPSEKEQLDVQARVKEIKKLFNDLRLKDAVMQSTASAIERSQAAKAAKRNTERSSSPLTQLKISLNRVVRTELKDVEERSFSRFHPSYEDQGLLVPGRVKREKQFKPSFNVYWDKSGSFSDPKKTEGSRQAIALLDKYVKKDLITVKTYYFADKVSDNPDNVGYGNTASEVFKHIKETKPQNVIIITDSGFDFGDGAAEAPVVVPGAVWLIFYDGRDQRLVGEIKGRKETRIYDIDY